MTFHKMNILEDHYSRALVYYIVHSYDIKANNVNKPHLNTKKP